MGLLLAFRYEIDKITKKTFIILILFLLVSLYLTETGIKEYNDFWTDVEAFIKYEEAKVKGYPNMQIYGNYGFRLIAAPPPISVFFASKINYESNIDVRERVDIRAPIKGVEYIELNDLVGGLNFAAFWFIFGSLIATFYGADTWELSKINWTRRKANWALMTILVRIILMLGYFSSVLIVTFIYAKNRVDALSGKYFIAYAVYLLISFIVFFMLSALLALLFRNQKVGMLLWFLFVFIIPGLSNLDEKRISNDRINKQKLDGIFRFENSYKEYSKELSGPDSELRKKIHEYIEENYAKIYMQNLAIEQEWRNTIKRQMDKKESISIWIMSDYIKFLERDISGKGNHGYIQFWDRVVKLRDDFYQFYIDRRYVSYKSGELDVFLKAKAQIVNLNPYLTTNYYKGLGVLIIYILFLAGILVLKLQKNLKNVRITNKYIPVNIEDMKAGKLYWIHKNKDWEAIKNYLIEKEGAELIEKLGIQSNVKLRGWIGYQCYLENISPGKLLKLIDSRNDYIASYGEDYLQKIVLKIKYSKKAKIYLVDSFLDGMKTELEKYFIDLIQMQTECITIYCGKQMYRYVAKEAARADIKKVVPIHVIEQPQNITLK